MRNTSYINVPVEFLERSREEILNDISEMILDYLNGKDYFIVEEILDIAHHMFVHNVITADDFKLCLESFSHEEVDVTRYYSNTQNLN